MDTNIKISNNNSNSDYSDSEEDIISFDIEKYDRSSENYDNTIDGSINDDDNNIDVTSPSDIIKYETYYSEDNNPLLCIDISSIKSVTFVYIDSSSKNMCKYWITYKNCLPGESTVLDKVAASKLFEDIKIFNNSIKIPKISDNFNLFDI